MAAQFDLRLKGDAVAGKEALQKAPCAGFTLQQHQREVGKLRQRIGTVGFTGIVSSHHKHIMKCHAAAHSQVAGLLRGAGKGKIHLPCAQHLQRLIAGAVQHL